MFTLYGVSVVLYSTIPGADWPVDRPVGPLPLGPSAL